MYKYQSGKIRIKSKFELDKDQIGEIVEIINEVMSQGFYEPCYQISQRVCHAIEDESPIFLMVKTKHTRSEKFIIKLIEQK